MPTAHRTLIAALGAFAVSAPQAQDETPLPMRFRLRPGQAGRVLDQNTSDAINRGLAWLAAHQDDDGKWSPDKFNKHDIAGLKTTGKGNPKNTVGITGLALLAFLAEGQSMTDGDYAEVVAKGTRWLISKQNGETGLYGTDAWSEYFYCHCIATLVVIEASGLSGDQSLRNSAQKGITHILTHRDPKGVWRYYPKDGESDTSVTGWATLALWMGRDFGYRVPPEPFEFAMRWMDAMTSPTTGRLGYIDRGGRSARKAGDHGKQFPRERGEPMTGIGLFVRTLLGRTGGASEIVEKQRKLILSKPPSWNPKNGSIDLYSWLWCSMAMRLSEDRTWDTWKKKINAELIGAQRDEDNFDGSWDPIGVWGEDAGRVYATAMASLILQTEYRYPPLRAVPLLPEGATFATANRSWSQGAIDRAYRSLELLGADEELTSNEQTAVRRAKETLDREIAWATAEVEACRSPTNPFAAKVALEAIEERYGRLPVGQQAKALLRAHAKDKSIQVEFKALDKYEKLLRRYPKAKDRQGPRFTKALRAYITDYGRTITGKEAKALLSKILGN